MARRKQEELAALHHQNELNAEKRATREAEDLLRKAQEGEKGANTSEAYEAAMVLGREAMAYMTPLGTYCTYFTYYTYYLLI